MKFFQFRKDTESEIGVRSSTDSETDIKELSSAETAVELHLPERDTTTVAGKFMKMVDYISIKGTHHLTVKESFLYNYDLKPLEAERRTWSKYNYIYFCFAECFNVNTWQISSTSVVQGLPWWATLIAVAIGYSFCGLFIATFARVGNYYHISFPVSCRSSFGIWGSLWPVLNRVVMACVWFGVQSTIGGNCVELMLRSIFSNDLNTKIPNHLPASANITSFQMLAFFLFWIAQIPLIMCPPHKLKWLFTVKFFICMPAGFAFLIWALIKAPNIGELLRAPSQISGSEFGWVFVNAVVSCLANLCTLIINAPDFGRFADSPNASYYTQMVSLPLGYTITCLIGILVSTSSQALYGEAYWNPLDVLGKFLDHYSRGSRGGVFLISTAFAVAQVGFNISANSLSAGTDMTALLPKFINIRRGGLFCAAIGFAICPWNLMTSSSRFATYLSAYAVFLSAIAGCIFCDYFILKKGMIKLHDLFIAKKSSVYYYSHGVNYRAYAAYLLGIIPNITGFVGATGHEVPIGATRTYTLSFFTGFLSSLACMLVINMIWPTQGRPDCGLFDRVWLEEWAEVEDFDIKFRADTGADEDNRSETAVDEIASLAKSISRR